MKSTPMKWLSLIILLLSGPTLAATLQPLTPATLPELNAQHSGERHSIIYWSLDCLPCRAELKQLSSQITGQPAISLVNTDAPTRSPQVSAFLNGLQLKTLDNWQFADAVPARLRAAIDPSWYGALPRSYAIDAHGKTYTHAGRTPVKQLLKWLQE